MVIPVRFGAVSPAVFLLALGLVLGPVAGVGAKARVPKIHKYRFDGFRLGARYDTLRKRRPYKEPCDNDPIDKRRLRAMVYGALPCRGRVFPEQTTVVFYLPMNTPQTGRYRQPIRTLAFLHGSYFRKRSNFPVQPGDRLAKARKLFGRETQRFILSRKKSVLTAHGWRGTIWILAHGDVVRGVVVGPMPTSPMNEVWRVLIQMYDRYTPKLALPPLRPRGMNALCRKVYDKAKECHQKNPFARAIYSEGPGFTAKCLDEIKRGRGGTWQCFIRTPCAKLIDCTRGPDRRP